MAEADAVSEILGADKESTAEGLNSEPPLALDSTASALAAEAAKDNPELAEEASEYFRKQSRLVEIQTEHLHEQRVVNLQLLKLKRFDEQLRVGLRLFVILAVTVIGIGGIIVIHDAVTSRSVVIDSFDAPPALAERGLSGKVVAAGLLDVLGKIQAATRTSAERRSLSNAWTNDLAIDVPETGVSFGQLERILKTRFGHDQHIDGELVQNEYGGLALTVRGTGILPKTFKDETLNLDKLITEAAEYVYSQSQPGLWTNYLANAGRNDEAIRFAERSYAGVEVGEKPYVLNYWANAIVAKGGPAAMEQAMSLWRQTVRLKPDYWVGYNNVMTGLVALGHEEEVIGVFEEMMKRAGGRPGKAPENMYQNYDSAVWDLRAAHASNLADMESHGGIGTLTVNTGAEGIAVAQLEVQMHDLDSAALRLQTTPVDENVASDVAIAAFSRALLAEELGDRPTAAKEWDTFATAAADPGFFAQAPQFHCYSAVTYQMTGQPQKADAALNKVDSLTLVDCFRFRGDVQDLRGNWAGAQEWYEKAVRLAPSLPAGYYSWGIALARRGDLAGAATKLELAHQRGPHWADPLKAWGDVLVRQGNARGALAKYDDALKYAPNWKQTKESRASLAKVSN